MDPDENVCHCFRVSLRKISNFLARENPPVASRIADCLGAGTGCRGCVPHLEDLYARHRTERESDLPMDAEACGDMPDASEVGPHG